MKKSTAAANTAAVTAATTQPLIQIGPLTPFDKGIFMVFANHEKNLVYLNASLLDKMSKFENAEKMIQKNFVGCNEN